MKQFEKILSQLPDMEAISPNDRLSRLLSQTAQEDDGELDEQDLDLVSAATAQPYQEFLRRLGRMS